MHPALTPLLALSLALLVSCRSTGAGAGTTPPPQGPRVSVEGAEATVDEDGSISLKYPVDQSLNYRVPEWVINPALGGVTGAVGAASPSPLGTREQLDAARFNGRLELASMLELRVQRIIRSELEENSRAEGGSDAGVARRDTLGIDKEILDTVMAGTRQRALWWDKENGELFVWMVVDGAVRDRVDQSVRQDVSIFTATASLPNEYRPSREQPKAPKVIVQMPEAPAVPTRPDTPVEQLEGALKPIETIPTGEKGGDGGQ